jgi:hypothetical protein
MDERYAFWQGFKYTMYALGATFCITYASAAVAGDLASLLDVGGEGNSTRVILFQVSAISTLLLFIAMFAIG